jgi:hypothetical protein
MPDVAPVMKMVLPVSFMMVSYASGVMREDQPGNRSPNIGKPLTDSALVASS